MEKYRIEFSDLKAIEWRISISEAAFTGDYTLLKATGNPLVFSFDNETDDVFDPIRASRAVFEVYSETNFVLTDLYSVEDKHFTVEIYENGTLYWRGYVETQNYKEVYEPSPYAVSITATDGLSILQNILYADEIIYAEGNEIITYYNGRIRESKIILDVLAEIGHTSFYEFVNLYEDDMENDVGDSPMDQIKIDADVFQDYYCWDVLTEVLKKYNAFIRQRNGYFYIIRPTELTQTTIYGRYFTAETTKTGVSINPDQFIKRTLTHPSSRRVQVPGGTLMIQPPAKKVSIIHDYGFKDSWLDNYELKSEDWGGADFKNWTRSTGCSVELVSKYVPGELEGVMMTTLNDWSGFPLITGMTNYLYQSFGVNAIVSTYDRFNIEFDYMTYNFHGSTIPNFPFLLVIKADVGSQHLYNITGDENFNYWYGSTAFITLNVEAPNGNSSWTTYKRQINGLPTAGSYTCRLYATSNAYDCYIAFRRIKFYVTSDNILVKRRKHKGPFPRLARWILKTPKETFKYIDVSEITESEYNVFNNINGEDKQYDFRLGDVIDPDTDNIIEQCGGALGVMKRTDTTAVDTITLTGTSGQAYITCGGYSAIATFNSDLTQTAIDFVTAEAANYDGVGIVLTSSGDDLIFTNKTAGVEFDGDTSILNMSGSLFGSVVETSPAYTEAIEPSNTWMERGSYSSKPLLHLIGDEIAEQYARPKQLIQMPIIETAQGIQIDTIGNFQDDVNTYNGDTRVFVMNRGEFNVRPRKWEIDLFEIGVRAATEEETLSIKLGFLYNWHAVDNARGLAPVGTHIPDNDEFQELINYLGVGGGGKLKAIDESWLAPNTGASNDSGFTALCSNFRYDTGDFAGDVDQEGMIAYFYSTELNGDAPYFLFLSYDSDEAVLLFADYGGDDLKNNAASIRCLLDDPESWEEGDTITDIDGNVYNTVKIGEQVWLKQNLVVTKYRDGTDIPNVTDNTEWAALASGAYCAYNNDLDNAYTTEIISTTADSDIVTVDSDIITVDTI